MNSKPVISAFSLNRYSNPSSALHFCLMLRGGSELQMKKGQLMATFDIAVCHKGELTLLRLSPAQRTTSVRIVRAHPILEPLILAILDML